MGFSYIYHIISQKIIGKSIELKIYRGLRNTPRDSDLIKRVIYLSCEILTIDEVRDVLPHYLNILNLIYKIKEIDWINISLPINENKIIESFYNDSNLLGLDLKDIKKIEEYYLTCLEKVSKMVWIFLNKSYLVIRAFLFL